MLANTKLTDKQERFVQNLIRGITEKEWTQRKAYKEAYDCSKMKDKSIDERACKLLKEPKVRARYEELKAMIIEEIEEKLKFDAKKIISEVASIAFDDIGNYLDFRMEKQIVGYDKDELGNDDFNEPLIEYRPIVDVKDSKKMSTKNISEIAIGKDGQFKMKLYSRETALYKLMDYLGISKPKGDGVGDSALKILDGIMKNLDQQAEE